MFFDDEKDDINQVPELDLSNDEDIVSWDGILDDDQDDLFQSTTKGSSEKKVDDEIKFVESVDEDDILGKKTSAKSDIKEPEELERILSEDTPPKQKAFDAFGSQKAASEEDINIDKQLENLDSAEIIEDISKNDPAKNKKEEKKSSPIVLFGSIILIILLVYMFASKQFDSMKPGIQSADTSVSEVQSTTDETVSAETQGDQENIQDGSIPVVSEDDASDLKPDENEKKEVISVQQSGRSNPFLPLQKYLTTKIAPSAATQGARYKYIDYETPIYSLYDPNEKYEALGVPSAPKYYVEKNNETMDLMTISVSGIMYDPNKPSAIITYKNYDYFVQKGDWLDNYKVIDIQNTYVKIALDRNIYKASVGESFKISSEFNGNAQYIPEEYGGGRQYHSVSSYVSENDIQVGAKTKQKTQVQTQVQRPTYQPRNNPPQRVQTQQQPRRVNSADPDAPSSSNTRGRNSADHRRHFVE